MSQTLRRLYKIISILYNAIATLSAHAAGQAKRKENMIRQQKKPASEKGHWLRLMLLNWRKLEHAILEARTGIEPV